MVWREVRGCLILLSNMSLFCNVFVKEYGVHPLAYSCMLIIFQMGFNYFMNEL